MGPVRRRFRSTPCACVPGAPRLKQICSLLHQGPNFRCKASVPPGLSPSVSHSRSNLDVPIPKFISRSSIFTIHFICTTCLSSSRQHKPLPISFVAILSHWKLQPQPRLSPRPYTALASPLSSASRYSPLLNCERIHRRSKSSKADFRILFHFWNSQIPILATERLQQSLEWMREMEFR